jgi:sulfite exporter TauE/SafE
MSVELASIIAQAFGLYFAIGALFALLFVFFGAQKIDPAAKTMPVRARLLILPGTIGLWPLMALKWLRQTEPPLT